MYTYVSKECTVGRDRRDCKEICNGHCEGNAFCNHMTGQFDGGCAVGWTRYLCDKGILNHWSKVESYRIRLPVNKCIILSLHKSI